MSYLILFFAFFKIGIVGFGGGLAMLPVISQSVESLNLMSNSDFMDLVAISQVTPGAIAINVATYVGESYGGIFGAVVATLGVALPSFVLILLVMKFMSKYRDSTLVVGVMEGVRPASVGLIGAALLFIAMGVLFTETQINIIPCIMFLVTAAAAVWNKINPVWVIIAMGILGAFLCS